MAHKQQIEFVLSVKKKFLHCFSDARVLEVGSLNINGSVRDLFTDCEYTGIDVGSGRGVDVVVGGHEYDAPDGSFDTVISCECFEHNPYWKETFRNMVRMTRKGGLVVVTCATTGRLEHGTTRTTPRDSPLTVDKGWDYYRNLVAQDFYDAFDMAALFTQHEFAENLRSSDLYLWGIVR